MAQTAIKISVIGAGFVGSTVAYTLVMKGVASEIVLVDVNLERAEGEAMDISHGAPFAKSSVIRTGSYEDTKGSDVVIITAGTNQKPGETRIDLITRNAAIMRDVAGRVGEQSPNAVILVISNPVDVMTYVARQVTGFPKNRVIGSGTVLDSSRFRYLLANRFDIDPRNVHGYIMGEHGDSEFPAWSLVNIAGMSLDEASDLFNKEINDEVRQSIADSTRNAAYEIINRKGATYYGIGMSATRIVEAIVRDERSIMTVSSLLHGEYDIDDLYLSVPAILGEHGIEKVLTPRLSDLELANLHHSAEVLRDARNQIQ
ncbi:MAG TPA: L-lactate dehydrogenase [Candidatus Nanoperiomorbaceae bacterium]|nr:MAG: L-lactate dehydrogenase [Candidatus Saccharibacteria bacterium]HMQ09598.1 L-lactate dehydrogenase [Candidatus Nanoperiomorbaceae bacterium]HMQ97092.1 L-lactate dehydrogenase [Candidatus Nanoperiomorbaceae bacterium]HMR86451.1 L-lactate dehydrogenase [Candidatus Nanoperiomorbaceae bacterium]HMU12180.1 L-lactate dehydrogenase [Candidatus Nanoperiomorbaceae bacterium]